MVVPYPVQAMFSMKETEDIYRGFSEQYELFEGKLSHLTWELGIIPEIKSLPRKTGCIFDAGAGTGIGATHLKTVGNFQIVSCDQSASMLAKASLVSDEILKGDLASLPSIAKEFDFIVSGGDALNYLDRRGLSGFFAWCSEHLSHDGALIFDYSSPKLLRDLWRTRYHVDTVGDWRLEWNHHFEEETQRAEILLTCSHRGLIKWQETHYQYPFDRVDIEKIAGANSLRITRFRNLDGEVCTPDAIKHVYVLKHSTHRATTSGMPEVDLRG